MWTEKSYEESTLNSKSQTSKEWLSNREETRLNIEKDVLMVDIRPNKEVIDALIQTLKKSYIIIDEEKIELKSLDGEIINFEKIESF